MTTLGLSFLVGSSLFLQVTRTSITPRMFSKFGKVGPRAVELAALERLEKSPKTYNGKNVVTTLAPSILIESSSFFAGDEDMQYESLDEFKFRPDTTTDSRVVCP